MIDEMTIKRVISRKTKEEFKNPRTWASTVSRDMSKRSDIKAAAFKKPRGRKTTIVASSAERTPRVMP